MILQKLLAALVSLSVVAAPMQASADRYVFRYRTDLAPAQPPELPEPEFSQGNDIQAWFVAPVGVPFHKAIPVLTKDVAGWKKSEGELPSGIDLELTTGVISGRASTEQRVAGTWLGRDSTSNAIARAKINFSTFKPVGQVTEVSWYTHTGEYFYRQVPGPDGVEVVRWEALDGVGNPQGMSTRNGAFDGHPAEAGTYAVAWRGFDYLNREVAFTYGSLLVQDGPVVEPISDQVADKAENEVFNVSPQVKHAVGTITYSLRPVSGRPGGLTFRSSDGRIDGVFDDYDTTARFVIEARDSGTGRTGLSNEFSLTTLPELVGLSGLRNLEGVVGQPFERVIVAASGKPTFELTAGTLPKGIRTVNSLRRDGRAAFRVFGTPEQVEIQQNLQITASGSGVQTSVSPPFSFRIFSAAMKAVTDPLYTRTDSPFSTNTPTVTEGEDPPYSYSLTRDPVAGMLFDQETGQFHSDGIASAGDYDSFVVIRNESDREVRVIQAIRVYNPITISYGGDKRFTRLSDIVETPMVADRSIREPGVFTISPALPDFLKLNPSTGEITGRPTERGQIGTYGPFVVTVSDAFKSTPVASDPFSITIEDRPALAAVQDSADVLRWVENQQRVLTATNAFGGVSYEVTSRGNLPSSLDITPTGFLVGNTTDDLGTVYSGITVVATDGDGAKSTVTLSLTVKEPGDIGMVDGGLDRTFVWTKNRDFIGFAAPRVTNTFGTVTYTLDASALPVQIDQTTLAISGRIDAVGTVTIPYEVADQTTRDPVRGLLTFIMQDDMAVSQPDVSGNRGASIGAEPLRTNGVAPFRWEIVSGRLPATGAFPAMSFNASSGAISGIPREEGTFPITVRVTDATKQVVDTTFVMTVDKPLPFSAVHGDGGALRFVVGQNDRIGPTYENRSDLVKWQIVGADLPPGLSLVPAGLNSGIIHGAPLEDGRFSNIALMVEDTGTGETYTETLTIEVLRAGDVGLHDALIKHRIGSSPVSQTFVADNVTAPVVYEIENNAYPENVSIDANTGELSAAFADEGRRTVTVKATDTFERSTTATVILDIVGDLEIATSDPLAFKQYDGTAIATFEVKNLIGTATFTAAGLPSGLSVNDAVMGGEPQIAGTFASASVTVKDAYDGAEQTTDALVVEVAPREALTLTASDVAGKRYGAVTASVSVTDAIGDVRYSVTPSLPAGLAFDEASGTISGSSDELFEGSFVIAAIDSKGGELGTATAAITLSIAERDAISLAVEDLAAKQFGSVNWSPVATGMIGETVYSISPSLPSGLTFDPSTGSVTGSVEDLFDGTFTLTAIDSKGGPLGTATATFALTIAERDSLELTVPDLVTKQYQDGSTIADSKNAIGEVTYSIAPDLPSEFSFDTATGGISGMSEKIFDGAFTMTATDEKGGDLGTSSKTFSLSVAPRDALTITAADASAKRHAALAFKPTTVNAIGAVAWTITPDLPAGLVLDPASGSISGSLDQLFDGTFSLKGKDSKGGDFGTATASIRISVVERDLPVVTTAAGQPALYDHPWSLTLSASGTLGEFVFEHVSGDLPAGVKFDPSSGSFTGIPTVLGTFPVTVRVTDTFKGVAVSSQDVVITINVKQDGSAIALDIPKAVSGRIGVPLIPVTPAADNTIGDLKWSAQGLDGTGLVIDARTGVISGTPLSAGPISVVVTVEDVTLRKATATVAITVKGALGIDFPTENTLTYYYRFDGSTPNSMGSPLPPVRQPLPLNANAGLSWSLSGGSLPSGLTFNGATGRFDGYPLQIGQFGPYTISLSDDLSGPATIGNVYLDVVMNDDPIDLAVKAYTTKVGFAIQTEVPVYGNELGTVTFFPENNDLVGTGLRLDPATGVITGIFRTPQDRNINVAISDEYTTRVTSRPLLLKVLPLLSLTAPASPILEAQAPISPVKVTAANVAGTLVFEELDDAQKALLPEGITFDRTSGSFVGQTDELGLHGPIEVRATDSFLSYRDEAVSNKVTLDVRAGALFLKLTGMAIPAGRKYTAFSWSAISQLQNIGVDEADLRWSMTASKPGQALPKGLSLDARTGRLSGNPTENGDFTFDITVTGKGRTSTDTFTLHLDPAIYDLQMSEAQRTSVSWNSFTYNLADGITVATNVDTSKITWKLLTNPIPTTKSLASMGLSKSTMSGKFTHSGTYVFEIEGTYINGSDTVTVTSKVTVTVTDPPPVAYLNWTIRFTGNVAGSFEFTGQRDVQLADLQLFDKDGNRLVPTKVYSYYGGYALTASAWDQDPGTIHTNGLGSGLVFEFPSKVTVHKARFVMSGTTGDVASFQSMRSDGTGWTAGSGWLTRASDYHPLPRPASGGSGYAPGEVVEVELWAGQPK